MKAHEFCGALSIVSLAVLIVASIALTFAYPDMTRTRLLLTFWPIFAVGTALTLGFIAVGALLRRMNGEPDR